ncbi:hypothetical protein JW933_08655 [candidate division FCPU426 bacterium]|nr:hypothetical protein [candidate division FCPU426 bacterium]
MIRWLLAVLVVTQIVLIGGCCTPKRWADGDPRDKTPLPTPTILATVEIGVGVDTTVPTPAPTMEP